MKAQKKEKENNEIVTKESTIEQRRQEFVNRLKSAEIELGVLLDVVLNHTNKGIFPVAVVLDATENAEKTKG